MAQQARLEKLLELLMLLNTTYGRSIEELVERFNDDEKKVSTRTMYRYIDTIKQAGFVVDKEDGRYKINSARSNYDISRLLHFSEEEAFILSKTIHEIEGDNEYKNKLAEKLYSLYDFNRVSHAITRKKDSENILRLIDALKREKQVVLKEYRSANSKTTRDRKVEPVGFTYNYTSIWAFDTEDKKNKLFRTSRFSTVEILDQPWLFSNMHKKKETDIFRTSGEKATVIQLKLTSRAHSLLIEEYPLAEKEIEQIKDNEYLLNTKVYAFEGVSRFIMGLPEDISIITPKKLKKNIKERVELFLKKLD